MLYGVDNVSLTMLMLSFFPLQLFKAVHQFHAGVKKPKECVVFIRKIQQDATMYQNLLFHIYMKLNMFQATHHPPSGA